MAAWPFPYQTLDVEVVRNYGHQAYYRARAAAMARSMAS